MKRYSVALAVAVLVAFVAPVLANPFSDVPFSHWAYDAVKKLCEKGIMTGMPDGTFKGDKGVSRYELAVTLARTLDKMGTLKGKVDATDIKTLEKLTVEFADELALLGVKVTALEDELQTVRDDIAVIKADVAGAKKGGCAGSCGGIMMTGDAKITIDNLKFENDSTDTNADNVADIAKDDLYSYYQIGFNFAAPIDEDISTFVRVVNEEYIGNQFDAINGMAFGIDLAYVDVKSFFDLGNIRVGRQFAKVGHSLVLDDKLDAIAFCKDIDDLKVMFIGADQPAWNAKNGFNLKVVDLKYAFDEHAAEFYYVQSAFDGVWGGGVAQDPVTYGLTLDGGLIEKVDYMLEYAKYDPDVAGGVKGSALMGGLNWDFTEKLGVELIYSKGDEEFAPTSIYYHNRLKDMFGRMNAAGLPGYYNNFGAMPRGTTLASGSISGIKDIFVKLSAELTEKTDGCLVYEKVEANDSSGENIIFANAQEYKRLTIGIDHQYAPNTVFGLRYDTVEYDLDAVNNLLNAGGWNRVRVEMSVKF